MSSFPDHVALLDECLDRRHEIVERIEARLLNVQGKETSRRRDRPFFDHALGACVFGLAGLRADAGRLRGQLQALHLADGFEPVVTGRLARELDPLDLVVRAYERWDQSRWPGKNGRLTFAATIGEVFFLKQIEQLSLRIWDDGGEGAEARLREVQRVLDRLNASPNPRVFVRDARWLMQTAQGPLTRHLRPYFTIADRIAGSLPDAVRVDLHGAGARLAGGHMRSQLHYRHRRSGRSADDAEVVAFSRASNALDLALLVRDLIPLLEAYQAVRAAGDTDAAVGLADAILQGCSSDPDLCLTRLDLLGPCTMVEDLFVARGEDGRARYTPMGEAHVRHLQHYGALVGELAGSLREDAARFDPRVRTWSPYGMVYGFVSELIANMALETLVPQPSFGLSLEDMFDGLGLDAQRLARAESWQRLPQRSGEGERFVHSPDWAAETYVRLTRALDLRAARPASMNASERPGARVFIVERPAAGESAHGAASRGPRVPAVDYCYTSSESAAFSSAWTPAADHDLMRERTEARLLASARVDGGWFGVSKLLLTMVLGEGRDALIQGAPPQIVEVLRLMCPALVVNEAETGVV